MRGKNWSKEEKQLLGKNYNKIPMEELNKLFPTRCKKSIQKKAIQMHITSPHIKWQEEEDSLLKEIWHKQPHQEILKKFNNRSLNALHCRAQRLELNNYNSLLKAEQTIKPISKEEWSYIAGFLDGEGTITMGTREPIHRKTGYIQPLLCLSNTNLEVMKWIQNRIGGNIHPRQKHDRWKLQYQLSISPIRHINQVLKSLLPYLIVKRERGKLMQEYCTSRINGRTRYSDKDKELYKKFKAIREADKDHTKAFVEGFKL